MRRFLVLLAVAAGLSACAPRPNIQIMPQAAQVGDTVQVFVGTTRKKSPDAFFWRERDEQMHFARVDVSIPPNHEDGKLEMPRSTPDPAKHFVASEVALYSGARDFRKDLSRTLRQKPRQDREIVIYVHGFNNTFADGVFRAAQAAHDYQLPGVMVHYSWPSHGSALGYAYDRDSALFARDGLVNLIETVSGLGAEQVTLVGHSMGAQLTMEALRQLALIRPGQVHRRIGTVILISPDIDVDVFRSQAHAIGRLPQPFVIFASKRDRALLLSAQITGEKNRLGNSASVDQVADLEVVMFDVSAFKGHDPLNHLTAITSPLLIQIFQNAQAVQAAFQGDMAGTTGLFPGTILTIQNATQIILSPVTAITTQ